MNRIMPNFAFNMMAFMFKFRDFIRPREEILEEVVIKSGDRVLDYGCGPGSYLIDLAEMVRKSGKIYALDIHPLAIQSVQEIARTKGLTNVETILSNCETGLPDNSVDIILLYDIFHGLSEPQAILKELHRILKPEGTLSLNDPHIGEDVIVSGIIKDNLFKLAKKGENTFSFVKQDSGCQG